MVKNGKNGKIAPEKKCPKPSGQGFRPPPQTGNAHMEVLTSWKGLPLHALFELSWIVLIVWNWFGADIATLALR